MTGVTVALGPAGTLAKALPSNEGIALARSAFMPKLALSANIEGSLGQISVDDMPY